METLDQMRDAAEAEVKRIGDLLRTFPRSAMGLTPDAVKSDPVYRDLKAASDAAFARLRSINARRVTVNKRRTARATAEHA